MRHILSAGQFDTESLAEIFALSSLIKSDVQTNAHLPQLTGKQLFNVFYEPSTRTRMSFTSAAHLQGMTVNATENAREYSSAAKGETLEDTIRNLCQYLPSAIVLRHFEAGAADVAASVSSVPIINAGDGGSEHPTQALLDLFTIKERFGRLSNLRVIVGGDLAHSRTIRSLVQMLCLYDDNHFVMASPSSLTMKDDVLRVIADSNCSYSTVNSMDGIFEAADVIYWNRLQKERLVGRTAQPFVIRTAHLRLMPKSAVIMNPLPRIEEIEPAVDDDPRAIYFEQAGNGLFLRMALLQWCLNDDINPIDTATHNDALSLAQQKVLAVSGS